MIKKHYSPNSRQALNVIWNAAGSYDFDPPFLAFYSNGTPDFYFNTVIGLAEKWLELDKITAYIDSMSHTGASDEYDEYIWLALESCLYKKEIGSRPALELLRKRHAENFFLIQQTLSKQQMELMSMAVYMQQQARWAYVTGRHMPLLSPRERLIYEALDFPADLNTDAVIERLKEFFAEYFKYSDDKKRRSGIITLKKLWGRRRSAEFKNNGHLIVRTGTGAGDAENAVHLKQEAGFRQETGKNAENRAYIEACFGRCVYSDAELLDIERLLCTGDDASCRLWFCSGPGSKHGSGSSSDTRSSEGISSNGGSGENISERSGNNVCGNDSICSGRYSDGNAAYSVNGINGINNNDSNGVMSKQLQKEISVIRSSVAAQRNKNLDYMHKNSMQVNEAIRKLSSELETVISSYLKHSPELSESGRLDTGRVYRLPVLNDKNVFLRDGDETENHIFVTLLLDASQSRMNSQELISSEAYILSESLERAGIRVQTLSFRSIRGYTVIESLKAFEERNSDGIFSYFASGWNRDSLAFKAAGHIISEYHKKDFDSKHILMILTDASPNDQLPLAVKDGEKRPRNYEGILPVEDARDAVKGLRGSDIMTAGVFHGATAHLENVYRIFGKEYIRIHSITQLAGGFIDLMQMLLSEQDPDSR